MPNIIIPMNNDLLLPHGTTLPTSSVEKLARFEADLADWISLASATVERLRALEERTIAAQQRLSDAERGNNETAQKQIKGQIEDFMTQRRALSPLLMERNSRAAELQAIRVRLGAWADKLPAGARFEAAPEQDIGSKPITRERIDAVRVEIRKLVDERDAVLSAAPAADELKAKIKASVEAMLASRDYPRPDMSPFMAGKGPITAPTIDRHFATAGHIKFDGGSSVLALLAWMDPAGFVDRLCAEVDDNRKDASAELTDAERQERLANIEAQILALDRNEEALIVAAKADGHDIPRRPNASPLAILGIQYGEKSFSGGEPHSPPLKVMKGQPKAEDGFTYPVATVRRVAS